MVETMPSNITDAFDKTGDVVVRIIWVYLSDQSTSDTIILCAPQTKGFDV